MNWQLRLIMVFAVVIAASALGWQTSVLYQRLLVIDVPVIDIPESEVDLGVLPKNMKVVRTIKVYNRGNGPLKVSDLRTGCGCTEVAIASRQIAPNSSTELRITQGPSPRDQLYGETEVFLFSNDPELPAYRLLVRFQLSQNPLIRPTQIDFGQINASELPAIGKCRIVCPKSESPSIKLDAVSASVDASFLSAKTKNSEHMCDSEFEITLGKDAPLGELYYPLHIQGADGKAVFETNIIGNVKGWCFALPQAVDFGNLSHNGERVKETVQFINRDDADSVTIKEIQISKTLKDILRVELHHGQKLASVSVSVDMHDYKSVWSTQKHCGYFMALCADSHGAQSWTAVPVRLQTVAPKFREELSQ